MNKHVFLLVAASAICDGSGDESRVIVASLTRPSGDTVVSGNVVFAGQPRSLDVLLLPFEGSPIRSAEDRSRQDKAGLYLFTTDTVDETKKKVVVVPKDPNVSASRCVVDLEGGGDGPRKGRAPYLVLDDDPLKPGEAQPLDSDQAAVRIAHLTWAEDQRIKAGLVPPEVGATRIRRAARKVIVRVPDLKGEAATRSILQRAEALRRQWEGAFVLDEIPMFEGSLREDPAFREYERDPGSVWVDRARNGIERQTSIEPWMIDILREADQLNLLWDVIEGNGEELSRRINRELKAEAQLFQGLTGHALAPAPVPTTSPGAFEKQQVLDWIKHNPSAMKWALTGERGGFAHQLEDSHRRR